MFITLLSCCVVAASDNVANDTTATQNNDATVKTVEKNIIENNGETIKTEEKGIQSEDKTIGETDDNNEITNKNQTNAKAINKAKITSENTKTYCEGGKTKYFSVKNGKVNLSGINTNGNKVKEVTLVSGNREPYLSARDSTTDIVRS